MIDQMPQLVEVKQEVREQSEGPIETRCFFRGVPFVVILGTEKLDHDSRIYPEREPTECLISNHICWPRVFAVAASSMEFALKRLEERTATAPTHCPDFAGGGRAKVKAAAVTSIIPGRGRGGA